MYTMRIISFNMAGCQATNKELLKIFKNTKPDIVLLQELRTTDARKNPLKTLKSLLGMKKSAFIICHNFSKNYGKGKLQNEHLFEGLGILAKKTFKHKTINLPITKGIDRWPKKAILARFSNFTAINLHLSKYQESRKKQAKRIPQVDIISGDFNMQPEELQKSFPEYKNTFQHTRYTSYHSKKITLDYILIKKGIIIQVKTKNTKKSDHKMIIADIRIK